MKWGVGITVVSKKNGKSFTVAQESKPSPSRFRGGMKLHAAKSELSMDCIEDNVTTIIIMPNLWCRPTTWNHTTFVILRVGQKQKL